MGVFEANIRIPRYSEAELAEILKTPERVVPLGDEVYLDGHKMGAYIMKNYGLFGRMTGTWYTDAEAINPDSHPMECQTKVFPFGEGYEDGTTDAWVVVEDVKELIVEHVYAA